MPPVTQWLLTANIAVYVLENSGMLPAEAFALWPPGGFESRFEPWQLVTYSFLHANLAHIFFNMLALLRAVLLRGGDQRGAVPPDRHRGDGRAAGADGGGVGRDLRLAARLRDLLPAPAGDAALPADPDAGARLRLRLRGARALPRHHPDRGRRRALRTCRRHDRRLADD